MSMLLRRHHQEYTGEEETPRPAPVEDAEEKEEVKPTKKRGRKPKSEA